MSFVADERARVPFAVVGALLLVSASAHAATLAGREGAVVDRRVAVTLDRVEAEATAALRTAVREAVVDAAASPVIRPANTTVGRALNASSPFRDALRLRIHLAAKRHFERLDRRVSGARVAVTVPPVGRDSTPAVRAAVRRVSLTALDGGSSLRVTLSNVSASATRDGHPIARKQFVLAVTVASPVLLVHDRVESFANRVGNGPTEPGFGRGLTARLYPLVWARAYGQFGGAPIGNVLANRHVELAANGALLAEQRRAFGRGDPAARHGLEELTAAVLAGDIVAAAGLPPETAGGLVEGHTRPQPEETVSVDVDRSADAALLATTADLEDILRDAYRVAVRRSATVRASGGESPPAPVAPGPGWTLVGNRTTETVTAGGGWTDRTVRSNGRRATFATYVRDVTAERTIRRTWRRAGRTVEVRQNWTVTYRVEIRVTGRHAPTGDARPVPDESAFVREGPDGSPNLRDVPARALELLVDGAGGPTALARRAVGEDVNASGTVFGRRPTGLRAHALAELARLRNRVASVETTVPASDLAAGRANPAADLAAELRERRGDLLGRPTEDDGVSGRAVAAARAAYLAAVIGELDRRADRTRARNGRLVGALGNVDADVPDVEVGRALTPPRRRLGTDGRGPGGPVALSPDGAPAVLSRGGVSRTGAAGSEVPTTLAVRNANVFSLPTEAVGEAVAGSLLGSREAVGLRVAARTLLDSDAVGGNATLETRRERLASAVASSLASLRTAVDRALRLGTALPEAERRAAVDAAFARWDGLGPRALAATNGSLAAAVLEEADARADWTSAERVPVAARVRVALAAARRSSAGRVDAVLVGRTATTARAVARRVVADRTAALTERAARRVLADRWLGRALGPVLAGLPVAPVPGYWYATLNVWVVTVRGGYERFAVTVPGGPPDGAGARTVYVREESTVRVDVDGDGTSETLGRSAPVWFDVTTAVVVAVPPSGRGVGDVLGPVDERSPGWPCPDTLPARAGSCPATGG